MGKSSLRATVTAAALAATTALPAHAVRVDYAVDAGVEHDDNVRLAATDPESQRILRAGLGFLAVQEGSVLQAVVSGRADYRNFQRGIDDSVEGTLSAYVNWVLMPDRLSFTVQDELELQAIDRFAADSPDNRQQVNVLSLGPNLLFDLGPTLHGRVEARYIDTDAEVSDQFNSSRTGAALRIDKEIDGNNSLSFNLQWMDVDYDNALVARDHERIDAFVRYARIQSRTDYAIDAGYSRQDYADGDSVNAPLLRLDAGWRPSERSRLSVVLVNQHSDAAADALATGTAGRPEASVPGSVLVSGVTVTPSAYRERRMAVVYAHEGERFGWRVEPYAQKIRFDDAADPDEDVRGVLFGADYRLTPTLSLGGWAAAERTRYAGIAGDEDIRQVGLVLARQWTRHWSTSLSWFHHERESALTGDEVRHNVWYLWMTYRNRPL